MKQHLRHLIVIISLIVIIGLIPGCLCFAQEGAHKTPSTSPAQKPETELQRPNSAQVEDPFAVLPPKFRGAFRSVRKVELSPEANSWAVQIISGGGIMGIGKGDLTITSQGNLVWNKKDHPNEKENRCDVKLRDDVIQKLTQTAFSASGSGWSGPASSYCSDCFVYAIVLQRREQDGIGRTYVAYWDDSTDKNISEEARKVYDTFMTHKECHQ
jgi:hypothetical protein